MIDIGRVLALDDGDLITSSMLDCSDLTGIFCVSLLFDPCSSLYQSHSTIELSSFDSDKPSGCGGAEENELLM